MSVSSPIRGPEDAVARLPLAPEGQYSLGPFGITADEDEDDDDAGAGGAIFGCLTPGASNTENLAVF